MEQASLSYFMDESSLGKLEVVDGHLMDAALHSLRITSSYEEQTHSLIESIMSEMDWREIRSAA